MLLSASGRKRLAFAGVLVIAFVGAIVYSPASKIGIFAGWWFLVWAGKMDFLQYMRQFMDPAIITQVYRPVQALLIYLQYLFFGFQPEGYHHVQTLFHIADGLLLYWIVGYFGKMWRVAFLAALFFEVSPVISLAVSWQAVADPETVFFYLWCIVFWIRYLETNRRAWGIAAFAAFLFALYSKEFAVFLPMILFLIEWWFFHRRLNPSVLLRRYGLFVIALLPYIWLQLQTHSHSESTQQFGYRIGPQMLTNLLPYLATLAFPASTNMPTESVNFIWLGLVTVFYLAVIILKRNLMMLFLGIVAALSISPLSGFPLEYFNTRYLYLPMMVSAVVIALIFEMGWREFGAHRLYSSLFCIVITLLVSGSAWKVGQDANDLADWTRRIRVPFRDIYTAHPTFPEDTYLYFIYSPVAQVTDFEGLFFSRYGTRVVVGGTDINEPPNFRSHALSYVYYFDESGKPVQVPVQKEDTTAVRPLLPIRIGDLMTLDQYEVANNMAHRGKALVISMNFRAARKIDRDYMVYAYLRDPQGRMIAEYDGTPQNGHAPTSTWERNSTMLDMIVVRIDPEAAIGDNYLLEVGLYDPLTGNRLSILDANGQIVDDKFVIQPFAIVP